MSSKSCTLSRSFMNWFLKRAELRITAWTPKLVQLQQRRHQGYCLSLTFSPVKSSRWFFSRLTVQHSLRPPSGVQYIECNAHRHLSFPLHILHWCGATAHAKLLIVLLVFREELGDDRRNKLQQPHSVSSELSFATDPTLVRESSSHCNRSKMAVLSINLRNAASK